MCHALYWPLLVQKLSSDSGCLSSSHSRDSRCENHTWRHLGSYWSTEGSLNPAFRSRFPVGSSKMRRCHLGDGKDSVQQYQCRTLVVFLLGDILEGVSEGTQATMSLASLSLALSLRPGAKLKHLQVLRQVTSVNEVSWAQDWGQCGVYWATDIGPF